jgi:hypothetical protein
MDPSKRDAGHFLPTLEQVLGESRTSAHCACGTLLSALNAHPPVVVQLPEVVVEVAVEVQAQCAAGVRHTASDGP